MEFNAGSAPAPSRSRLADEHTPAPRGAGGKRVGLPRIFPRSCGAACVLPPHATEGSRGRVSATQKHGLLLTLLLTPTTLANTPAGAAAGVCLEGQQTPSESAHTFS